MSVRSMELGACGRGVHHEKFTSRAIWFSRVSFAVAIWIIFNARTKQSVDTHAKRGQRFLLSRFIQNRSENSIVFGETSVTILAQIS